MGDRSEWSGDRSGADRAKRSRIDDCTADAAAKRSRYNGDFRADHARRRLTNGKNLRIIGEDV